MHLTILRANIVNRRDSTEVRFLFSLQTLLILNNNDFNINIMENMEILFYDGYDEVRNSDTHETIFSTRLPESLKGLIKRTTFNDDVIDNVVIIWNRTKDLVEVDEYLLNEGLCTQEEREIIVESLSKYFETTVR